MFSEPIVAVDANGGGSVNIVVGNESGEEGNQLIINNGDGTAYCESRCRARNIRY